MAHTDSGENSHQHKLPKEMTPSLLPDPFQDGSSCREIYVFEIQTFFGPVKVAILRKRD